MKPCQCIQCQLNGLSERIKQRRQQLIVARWRQSMEAVYMPLQIKGLKESAIQASGHIDRIRKAYARLNDIAPTHAIDVESLANQLDDASSDLNFMATTLGNSAGNSAPPVGDQLPPIVEPHVPFAEQIAKVATDAINQESAQAVAPAPPTFQP